MGAGHNPAPKAVIELSGEGPQSTWHVCMYLLAYRDPKMDNSFVSRPVNTSDRILRAFLDLAGERGLAAATTKGVAEAAGVNEVTIFRHFRDKDTMALRAVERFYPGPRITGYEVDFDNDTPEAARAGVLAVLQFLRSVLMESASLVRFSMTEGFRQEPIRTRMADAPSLARDLILRALERARPQLRPEVDLAATALMLQGLIALPVLLRSHLHQAPGQMGEPHILEAGLRPFFMEATG